MSTVIETGFGQVEFNEGSVVMNEQSALTLFNVAIALKKNNTEFYHLRFRLFGTDEKTKVCNWIWCLIFEWASQQENNPFEFILEVGDAKNSEDKLNYSMVLLKERSSEAELRIPYPLLGKYAVFTLLKSNTTSRKFSPTSHTISKANLNTSQIHRLLHNLSYSKIGPEWAIENPYFHFPNFTTNLLDQWPIPSLSHSRAQSLSLIAWKYPWSRYRALHASKRERQKDLRQWQLATNEFKQAIRLPTAN